MAGLASPGDLVELTEPQAVQTPAGIVRLERVTAYPDEPAPYLEVEVSGETVAGDPRYRIVNPPVLVPDPDGDVEVGGQRYRHDPLMAVAYVVAVHGGAERARPLQ
ncbi:MAG TPA: hypothetical protein VFU47_12940 [Armatimonadota bacterium]|nr:hypothetical protein [Armatimonadota bacterium]